MATNPPTVENGFDGESFEYNSGKGFDHRMNGETNHFGFHYRMEDEAAKTTNRPFNLANDGEDHKTMNEYGIEVGYLPPDQRHGIPGEILAQLVDPEIDEDTEAAEALRENAKVKVGKIGKVARGVGAQSVRKLVKRATLRGQRGNRRGKPPRVPPGITATTIDATGTMLVLTEGDEEGSHEEGEGSSYSAESLPHDDHDSISNGHLPRFSTGQVHNQQQHPILGKHARIKDEGAIVRPTHEIDSKFKKEKQSTILEETEDIPVEVVAATMEAGKKLMGELDPHNMLQVQRWRRKNKKAGKKKRKSYVTGKVIDGRHEMYTLSIAMMLGIRTSIARTNTIIASSDRRNMLTPQDFMAEEKYEFAPKGSATTPPHKLSHTFKFKDYAPVAFACLRRMFGVNEFDFLLAVCGNANFIEFISNAKSGQFFFYSSDGKYMIKTMTNAESRFLRRILPHYFRHCTKNPNTLITKFLGMYRVKLYHLRRNVKFVIMNSVYYTDKALQTFYDLKGSGIGRDSEPGQDVLKDNDLRRRLPEDAICLPKDVRIRLREQIVADCEFLRTMKIMDYSMLIGVHHVPPKEGGKHANIAKTGLRIKERQLSHRGLKRSSSHGKESTQQATAVANFFQGSESPLRLEAHKKESLLREGKVAQEKEESTRKLIADIRESTYSVSNFEFAGLLEEDDDCSYLEGSEEFKFHKRGLSRQHPVVDEEVEFKKEQTIEQIYWPFHRFYDINGLRRMKAKPCLQSDASTSDCHSDLPETWRIPDFVAPLSNRKDGGLTMDTTGLNLPMTFHSPQGDRLYEGKIFFMGIIDILQQYSARKRLETTYRKFQNTKGLEPSCVSPTAYAERFINFFDEYTSRDSPKKESSPRKTDGLD